MFLDDFCNDSQGWGPVNDDKNDLTPCAQGVLLFFPLNLLFIIFGLIALTTICKMKSKMEALQIQGRLISNQPKILSQMCNFDLVFSILFTLGFSYGLITVIVLSTQQTNKHQLNYLIWSFSWFLASWMLYTVLYFFERRLVHLYAVYESPSVLIRWFWVIQFVLCFKNMISVLVAKYVNDTIDTDTAFYLQLCLIAPFTILLFRAILLKPLQPQYHSAYDSQYYPSKLSMQQAPYNPYSQLPDTDITATDIDDLSSARFESVLSNKLKPIHRKQYTKTVEEEASLFSILTFAWLSKVFSLGYKRPLEMEDLHYLRGADHAHESVKLFYRSWRQQIQKAKQKNAKHAHDSAPTEEQKEDINKIEIRTQPPELDRQPSDPTTAPKHERVAEDSKYHASLLSAILSAFGTQFFIAGPLKLLYDCFQYAGPVLLSAYLADAQKFHSGEKESIDEAYLYAVLLFCSYICSTFVLAQYFHRCFRTGMRVRAGLMAACYEKALKLTQSARSERTAGEVMTLVTVDVRKIRDVFPYCWMLVSAPFQITVAVYLLYQQIGWSVFVGLGVQTLFMAPLQMVVGVNARKLQKQVMKIRDKRMEVVNEVFGAMKIVKMYAWETSFGNKISGIRNEELAILRCYIWWYTVMVLFWGWAPTLVSLAAFIGYIADGNELTAQKAFVSISLFNLLRFPLAMLPMVVLSFIEAKVCMGRISRFLSANEIDPNNVEYMTIDEGKAVPTTKAQKNGDGLLSSFHEAVEIEPQQEEEAKEADQGRENTAAAILIRDAVFTWDDSMNQPALFDINIEFKHCTTTMVIGETGSGKSALLRAILGNVTKAKGRIVYGESRLHPGQHIKVAYSSQVAWIQNATLRNNILFGSEYNQKLYDSVLQSCALIDDLKILPGGDETEIGEKGINLSGGQKQRISLARAVYSNADVYVFDDPLSAVDSHVANHIFNRCFLELLKGKTIILATHAVSFLKYADNILVMDAGKVSMQGRLQELIDANINLTKFIISNEKSGENDADGEEDIDDDEDHKEASGEKALKRRKSTGEVEKKEKKKEGGQLVKEEERGVGNVSFAIYWLYVKAAGGVLLFLFYIGFLGTYYGFNTVATFWLAFWSDQEVFNHPMKDKGQWWWLDLYVAIQVSSLAMLFLSCVMALITRLRASQYLHESLLARMLHAPMYFFDTTPIGRIINRFARDMYAIDQAVPGSYQSALRITIYLCFTALGVCVVTPLFALTLIPLGIFYYYLQKYFITTSRELRRLSTLQNSPIYSNFSESIAGVDVLRSFGKMEEFSTKNKDMIDCDHEAYYPSVAANRWLAIRLEFIGNCLIGAAALFCAVTRPPAGLVGVALSTIMSVTQGLNWFVRQKAQLEQDIVSVERIDQYANEETPQEAAFVMDERRPPDSWPHKGDIVFDNVWMKYRSELEFVLKGLTFTIRGGEKIGVIGRTGAGKSSLFVTLLRLVEMEQIEQNSKIMIDDVDISTIGLQDLRSKLSVIPQDPVLFTGTVRFNLDPFEQKTDEELLRALELSHCLAALKRMIVELTIKKERDELQKEEKEKEAKEKKKKKKKKGAKEEAKDPKTKGLLKGIESPDAASASMTKINVSQFIDNPKYRDLNPLDIVVEENGGNFSVGQRQLLCLARAIVRGSKILLLDEATSAVDPQTDQLIQKTIRQVFQDNTILTIAHRIDTILDYDRILIMDKGQVLEYDTPSALLSDKKSKFSEIVQESFGVNLDEVLANKLKFEPSNTSLELAD